MNFSVLSLYHSITQHCLKWERNRLCLKINSQLNYPLRFGQDIYLFLNLSQFDSPIVEFSSDVKWEIWLSERVSSRHKISLRLKLQDHSAFSVILKTNIVVNTIFQTNCALLNHYLDSNSETTIPPMLLKITGWKIKNLKHILLGIWKNSKEQLVYIVSK